MATYTSASAAKGSTLLTNLVMVSEYGRGGSSMSCRPHGGCHEVANPRVQPEEAVAGPVPCCFRCKPDAKRPRSKFKPVKAQLVNVSGTSAVKVLYPLFLMTGSGQ